MTRVTAAIALAAALTNTEQSVRLNGGSYTFAPTMAVLSVG